MSHRARPRSRILRLLVVSALALGALPLTAPDTAHAATPDAFYDAPATVPPRPGVLLRGEPFARGLPEGARAWRILYTTSLDDATPAVASGLVIAPARPLPGLRPVVTWAHGTTGIARACAPSLLDDPLGAGAAPALDRVIAEGWVLVATDYVGLGTVGPHPYLVGEAAARATLDATRAARQLAELTLDNATVIWGHSQGGHAALWAGIIAPRYAPDVNVLGVAALAPASDLAGVIGQVGRSPLGPVLTSYLAGAWGAVYPDVRFDAIVRPETRDAARDVGNLCLTDVAQLLPLARQVGGSAFAVDPAAYPPLAERLRTNTPTALIAPPLLIAQGREDDVVPPEVQDRYVADRCAGGQAVEYRSYGGRGHAQIVAPDSPLNADLVQWTNDRLAAVPPPGGCRSVTIGRAGAGATLTGSVTYRQRIALPPGATVRVQLADVSRADAPAVVLGEQTITTTGEQVPIPFAVPYDPAAVVATGRYVASATISVGGRVTFRTTTAYPVLTNGNPNTVELVLNQTG